MGEERGSCSVHRRLSVGTGSHDDRSIGFTRLEHVDIHGDVVVGGVVLVVSGERRPTPIQEPS